jgi:ArsR family transcriptional regulator
MITELRAVEQIFKALADSTRLRMVGLLIKGEASLKQIRDTLHVPQRKAATHLAYLGRLGLVNCEKRGAIVYYTLAPIGDVSGALMRAVRPVLADLAVVRADHERFEKVPATTTDEPGAPSPDCGRPA